MSVLSAQYKTLADIAKEKDPSGKYLDIVEMQSQSNDILADMPFVESNQDAGHVVSIRVGLPTVYWRKANKGVLPSKGVVAQVTESFGRLEAWSEIDEMVAEVGGNPAKARMNESTAFVQAMGIEFAQTLFYGTAAAPEEFVGLSTRYSSLSANNAENIVSAGGSDSDLSSIWLIVWSPNTVFGIYPKGTMAGLQHNDHGKKVVDNFNGTTGARLVAYQDQFIQQGGIVVKDWRYAVRIPNIDISNLVGESSAADLQKLMIKAMHRIHNLSAGKACFYMNRSCHEMLDIQARDAVQSGGGLSYENHGGKPVLSFRGIPLRRCDALTQAESAVS